MVEPEARKPKVVVEQGDSPVYYRLRSDVVQVNSRSALGVAMRDGENAFTLTAVAGATFRFGRGSHAGLWSEAGYSYAGFHAHVLLVGIWPTYRGFGPEGFGEGAGMLAVV